MIFDFLFNKQPSELRAGDQAPDFELPAADGRLIKLSDFREKNAVVLYFYPKDNTFFCIAESSSFRDQYQVFKDAGAEVIGVSSDSPASHVGFAGKYKLPFILLSDEKSDVRRLYRVPSTMGLLPGRTTYVIDPSGVIRHVFTSQFRYDSHVKLALGVVKKLKDSSGILEPVS